MSNPEDIKIIQQRMSTCNQLLRGAELLETRARALILEAHEMRKLAARLEEADTHKTQKQETAMPVGATI